MSTILGDVRPSQVKIYASPEADVREDQPLDYLVKVNGYGMSEHYPLVVRIAPTGFPGDSTGLARELRHMLKREQLLEGVYDSFRKTPITLLASPRVSGKTTLLRSFARRYPGVNCIYVSFLHDSPATELLLTCGIDFVQRVSRLSVEETHVIMIDDAQAQYDDKAFWDLFACTTISWLPDNARFIISATYAMESLVRLGSVHIFGPSNFMLSDEEARAFLESPTHGLPMKMRVNRSDFVDVVVRECDGLVGALKESVDAMVSYFAKTRRPSEVELMEYHLSTEFLEQVTQRFGGSDAPHISVQKREFLAKCLAMSPNPVSLVAQQNIECIEELKKYGVLVQEHDKVVRFSSPLVYYTRKLFSNRAGSSPGSLVDLVVKVVESMSASVLRDSVVGADTFPKEATFQHMVMEGLALNTEYTTAICPELSRIFPSPGQPTRGYIDGEIGFFFHIPRREATSHRWGIELLVKGREITEHLARFRRNGKYAPLVMTDYAVIDFRGNETGIPTAIELNKKRITVFFKLGDFSTCRCLVGLRRVREGGFMVDKPAREYTITLAN